MSSKKTLVTSCLILASSILLSENSAYAQARSGATRRNNSISIGLGTLLSGLTRPPIMAPPIRSCRPAASYCQTTVYCDPQVSYLYSSTPAYNYAPPTYVQNTTNVYPGFNHFQPSDMTPAREWGGQAPTFIASRQIAGYGSAGNQDTQNMVFSSKRPAGGSATARSVSNAADEPENARVIGVAMGRGDKAFERGSYDEARAEYAKALILSENDHTARFCMGIAAFAQGEFKDAGEAVYEALLAAPTALSKFDVIKMFGNMDDFRKQLIALKEYLASNSQDFEVVLLGAVLENAAGNTADAIQLLQRINKPRNANAISELIKSFQSNSRSQRG